jgi:PEP-CTERM motif
MCDIWLYEAQRESEFSMKNGPLFFRFRHFVHGPAMAIMVAAIPTVSSAQGSVVWNGPTIAYTQPGSDPTQPANQDRLTSDVWLTRGSSQGLFNAATESFYTHFFSPENTEWAYGELANYSSLNYQSWEAWNGAKPPLMVGHDAVLHLIPDDIYLSIEFTAWGQGAGGFSYIRSTPSPVPEPQTFPLLGFGLAAIFLRRRKQP